MADIEWIKGNRAFYWTNKAIGKHEHNLCLQSKEYNRDMKGVTWVYYSHRDALKLWSFLNRALGKNVKSKGSNCNKAAVSKSLTPFCCPVCGGNGIRPEGYYRQTTGVYTSSTISTEQCRSCNGTGVVWG
jgi:hypothetical protein